MNWSVIIGFCVAAGLVLMGILLGAPIHIFVDMICLMLILFGSAALLLQAHGFTVLRTVSGAIGQWLCQSASWSSDEYSHAARVAKTGGKAAMLTGWVGMMIGAIQILHHTGETNLSTLGPACAVMILTLFYGLCLKMLIWVPLEAWLTEQAHQER